MATARIEGSSGGFQTALTRALLACGALYGLAYVVLNDVVGAALYGGYNHLDQAVSELSGTQAPSARFLRAMLPVFTALMLGFGAGIWRAAKESRLLRATGALVLASGVVGVTWIFFPMTSREVMQVGAPMGANDVGHIVLSALSVTLILSQMTLSALALRGWFALFTAAAAATLLGFGALMGQLTPHTAENMTPLMGFYERAMLGGWLVWMAVLGAVLMRRR